MKKRLLGILLIVSCFFVMSCGSSAASREQADGTVTIFSNAIKNYDFKAMTECTNGLSYDESMFNSLGDNKSAMMDMLKNNAKEISWEIKEKNIQESTANVKVSYSYKDVGDIISASYSEVIAKLLTSSISGGKIDAEKTLTLFKDTLESKKKTMKGNDAKQEIMYVLEKKEGKWYIVSASSDISVLVSGNAIDAMKKIGASS